MSDVINLKQKILVRVAAVAAMSLVLIGLRSKVPAAAPSTGAMLVIVHLSVGQQRLDAQQLLNLFSGTTKRWPDGSPVTPFNAPALSSARVQFDRAVLRMSPEQAAQFWIDKRVRGDGTPPRSVADPEILTRLVAALRGSISYVPEAHGKNNNVRVVARIRDGMVMAP